MIAFDASTLILITKIGLLDLFLDHSRGSTVIPDEVHRECCGSKRSFDAMTIQKAVDASRIEVHSLKDSRLASKLQDDFTLGRGEAEALALALERRTELVAIDDKHGIGACKLLGLSFTTALAILVRSREKHLLEKKDAIGKLELLARFGRYRGSIIRDAKSKLEGSHD